MIRNRQKGEFLSIEAKGDGAMNSIHIRAPVDEADPFHVECSPYPPPPGAGFTPDFPIL